MKKSLFVALLVTFALSGNLFAADLPAATGQDVVSYLTEVNYQSWQLWPGTTEKMLSQFPHGNFQTTRLNERALSAIQSEKRELPAGALIVKEEFEGENPLVTLSVMLKTDDGQWFYARYEGDQLIEYPGLDGMCNNCHVSMKKSDNLYLKAGSR